jgi:putative nucleotidyltransferase with HDIG domain
MVSRLMPAKIRWKIVAPYLVLTMLVAVCGTYLATNVVTRSLGDRFDTQLSAAAQVAADAIVQREDEHLETIRSIMFTEGVGNTASAGDADALLRLVEPILANDRRDYAHVFDASGRSILNLQRASDGGAGYETFDGASEIGASAPVQAVLAGGDSLGDKSAGLVQVEGQTILYTAGPLMSPEGVAGVIVVGSSLETFLPSIKLDALAEVTFYGLDGAVIGSTLGSQQGDLTSALGESRDTSAGPDGLAGVHQSTSIGGNDFDLLYGDLRVRNQTIGYFSVALPSSFIASATNQTQVAMMAVFGAATIAVLIIGISIAHGVTRPLLSLVRSARAVANGDLTVRSSVRSRDEVGTLASSINVMTERLANQHLQTIRALTSAIDARDPYTAGHSVRVGQLSVEIGRELHVPRRALQFLEVGGYLHDIGKIGVRDHILLKEGPLTKEERKLIEDHPRIGLTIVQHVDLASEVLDVVGGHHEKLDGSGYPFGREADEISMYARIAAVSDIYDALTTERPYKPASTIERAVELLRDEVTQGRIDARAVEGLIRALPRWQTRLATDKTLRGLSIQEIEADMASRRAV